MTATTAPTMTAKSRKTTPSVDHPTALPPAALQARLAQIPPTEDVVEYTLRVVFALAPQFEAAVREAAERHVREMFGGSQVYVPRRAGDGRASRNDAIRRDYRNGERIGLLARRYGLSETQVWRIVNGV